MTNQAARFAVKARLQRDKGAFAPGNRQKAPTISLRGVGG